MTTDQETTALFDYLIELGDDHLILGHRHSQWCGHAPMLEEDLALSNIALDLLGQARNLLTYAGEIEGKGRSEDDLAYLRKENEYKNLMLVERQNGDFAQTVIRQLFFSVFMEALWGALANSTDIKLAAIAQKAKKETAYHVRHAAEWTIRLGDGTSESSERINNAIEYLAPNIAEMFTNNDTAHSLIQNGTITSHQTFRSTWDSKIAGIFLQAKLDISKLEVPPVQGARIGRHTEAMGHILAEMQYMQRTYPNSQW